jgi:UDP-N-acetylmuramyl tripeptide synthase
MFRLARAAARLARAVSRRVGRTGGTTAPGRVLLKLSPGALRRMARELDAGSVLVSATNGKTTTAAMIAAALERAGRRVVHNRAGSNMSWGVATALLDAGREREQLGLFEVDEAWLPAVARDTGPRMLVLSNLFRDQLDRYGELELLADRWAELTAELDGRARFVLNADDPLVADLGREREGVTYFGVEDDSQALPGMQHAADSKHCRNCGHAYEYEAVYLGHMGRYRCPNCGRARPAPQVAATRVELEGMEGSRRRRPHLSWACRSRRWARRSRRSAARSGVWRRSP